MEDLAYQSDYLRDGTISEPFRQFTQRIFGIDFLRTDQLGVRFNGYMPFSLRAGETIVANVSMTPFDMILGGQRIRAAQIATVGVLPEYRGRGLARTLMERAQEYCRAQFEMLFLFANKTVLDFYPHFGYRPVTEHRFFTSLPRQLMPKKSRKLQLDRDEDWRLLRRLAERRTPVSRVCGVEGNASVTLLNLIYGFSDCLYHIPELDVVIVYEVRSDRAILVDIMGEKLPDFRILAPYLCPEKVQTVEFGFTPDLLGADACHRPLVVPDEKNGQLFVRGSFPVENEPLEFPLTAHT